MVGQNIIGIQTAQRLSVNNMAAPSNNQNNEHDVTLIDIFSKLSTLDHIESNLNNLHHCMASLEDRVATLECNQNEQAGVFDVMRAENQGITNHDHVNNLQSDAHKRVEFLEN